MPYDDAIICISRYLIATKYIRSILKTTGDFAGFEYYVDTYFVENNTNERCEDHSSVQ